MSLWNRITSRFRTNLAIQTPPVVSTIKMPEEFFSEVRSGNPYRVLTAMTRFDPELSGDIRVVGNMCGKYYKGIVYKDKEGYITDPDDTEDSQVIKWLTEAQRFASPDEGFSFQDRFIACGKKLMTHGDIVFYAPTANNKGVQVIQPLPMRNMTAIPDRSYLGNSTTQDLLQYAQFYVYCEGENEKQQVFDGDDMLQVSADNVAEWVVDLLGRTTFGMWSVSPIVSLKLTARWKMNTILNDILWRHRAIPREVHKLNLSMYTPDRYQHLPTYEERLAQAQTDALKAATAYRDELEQGGRQLDADQVYIIDKESDVGYTEPKTTTYMSPNQVIPDMNKSIHHVTQVPAIGEKSYSAAYWNISIAIMEAEVLAEKIKEAHEKLIRKHLKAMFKLEADVLRRFEIGTRLILGRDLVERGKLLVMLDSTQAFTPDEIRDEFGYAKLTKKQKEILNEIYGADGIKGGRPPFLPSTQEETIRDVQREAGKLPSQPAESD